MNFEQCEIAKKLNDSFIRLCVFCSFLICSTLSFAQSPSISVFYDNDYVETCQLSTCEAYTLNSFLESIGYDVETFEGTDSSAVFNGLACHETFFLPETESGDFANDISPEAAKEIRDYVSSGGLMIVMGSDGLLQTSSNSAENLNSIFSFDIQNVHFSSSGHSFLSEDLSYPFISAFPDSLRNFTTTNFIGNLPLGSEVLYYFDTDRPGVVDIPYGNGHIFYLGWSFFNGGPIGSQGPDRWSLLIQVLIENFSAQEQFPDCDYCDTKAPIKTNTDPIPISYLDLNGIIDLHSADFEYLYEDNCTLSSVKIISDSILGCSNSFVQSLILEVRDKKNNLLIDTLEINLRDTVIPEYLDFPDDVTIECNFDETPMISDSMVLITALDENLNIGHLGIQNFEIDTEVFPTGSIIESMEFYFSGSFNDVDDLWLSVKDETGNSALLYNQACNSSQEMNVWFSDDGILINCSMLNDGNIKFQSSVLGLNVFNGTQPSTKYTFSIINQGNLLGTIHEIGLSIKFSSDLRLPSVNEACGYQLSYLDIDSRIDCSIGTIIRSYTLVDNSGNRNIREHKITITDSKPVVISYPEDFFYQCGSNVSYLDSLDPVFLPFGFDEPVVADDCRDYTFRHSDRVLSTCGNGNIEIERTWVVESICEPNRAYTHKQLIGVQDTVSPVINALPGYVVLVDEEECLSGSNFKFPELSDIIVHDCDSDISIDMRVIDSSGVEFAPNELQTGNYLVEITVNDGCGNIGYQYVPVKLLDITPPEIQCKLGVTEYQLSQSGEAIVCGAQLVSSIDENCGVDKYNVSFQPTFTPDGGCLEVDCFNLGVKTVYVQVIDFSGNSAECSTQIRVVDKDIPNILCSDITISCDQVFDPLNYPTPLAFDNCNPNPYVECGNFIFVGNSCDSTYSRLCFSLDGNGNRTNNCTQRLTRVDTSIQKISWPDEFVQLACGGDPNPSFTGEPIILAGCGRYDISYGDIEFSLCSSPDLYGVERRWLVRNLCTQELHIFDQEISVSDATPPVFTSPSTSIVSFVINDFNCEREITIIPETTDDCSNIIFYSNSISGNSRELTATFEIGLHPVTFYAEDLCGNLDSIVVDISIEENKNPYITCKAEDDFFLNINSYVDIFPRQILDTAFDLCTDSDLLRYTISKVLPNGGDIGRQPFIRYECLELGLNETRIYVKDASSNFSYCDVIINVVDTFRTCPFGDFYDISGMIFTENGLVVGGSKVRVDGIGRSGFDDGRNGYYHIKALPKDSNYDISVAKNYDHDNGVTAFDIVLIQRHMLQLAFLSSPYKLIAADVDDDKKISVLDLAVIRSLLLGFTQEFSDVPSWRFVPELYEFGNPQNPFENSIPYMETVRLEGRSIRDVNFIGIKMGDVNNSSEQYILGNSTSSRSKESCLIEYQSLVDNKFLISISKPTDWVSVQLFFDLQNIVDIEVLDIALDSSEYFLEKDRLGIVWTGLQTENELELVRFIVTSYDGVAIQDIILLDEERMSLVSVNFEEEESVELDFVSSWFDIKKNVCFDVFPTIWRDAINISRNCNIDESFSIKLYDIHGYLVFEKLDTDMDIVNKNNLRNLIDGMYIVELIDYQGISHVFRTIKN